MALRAIKIPKLSVKWRLHCSLVHRLHPFLRSDGGEYCFIIIYSTSALKTKIANEK